MSGLKYFKRIVATGFCCVSLFLMPAPSRSAELLMVTLEHAPHSFTKDGKVTGASTEMLDHILTRMGHKPVFQSLPWKRAQQMIETGAADGIYTYTQTAERLNAAYYSNPVSFTSDVFFKRKSDEIQWQTFSDLRLYKVGASGGYNYPTEFLESAKKGEFVIEYVVSENPNFQNLKKLKAGRTDLFICNPDVCGFIIKTHSPEFADIDYIDKTIAPLRSFHVGFSKKRPGSRQIRDEFNKQYDEFLASGQLKQIYDTYSMNPDYEKLGSKGAIFLDKNAE